jgi:hypothetical protein
MVPLGKDSFVRIPVFAKPPDQVLIGQSFPEGYAPRDEADLAIRRS